MAAACFSCLLPCGWSTNEENFNTLLSVDARDLTIKDPPQRVCSAGTTGFEYHTLNGCLRPQKNMTLRRGSAQRGRRDLNTTPSMGARDLTKENPPQRVCSAGTTGLEYHTLNGCARSSKYIVRLKQETLCKGFLNSAGTTGLEPAISALTGPHVRPTTPRPRAQISYHNPIHPSSFYNPVTLKYTPFFSMNFQFFKYLFHELMYTFSNILTLQGNLTCRFTNTFVKTATRNLNRSAQSKTPTSSFHA
jgi:hypothetical protein